MPTQDEEIARHLAESLASGELGAAELDACTDGARRVELATALGLLQQRIALRLEAMRVRGSL